MQVVAIREWPVRSSATLEAACAPRAACRIRTGPVRAALRCARVEGDVPGCDRSAVRRRSPALLECPSGPRPDALPRPAPNVGAPLTRRTRVVKSHPGRRSPRNSTASQNRRRHCGFPHLWPSTPLPRRLGRDPGRGARKPHSEADPEVPSVAQWAQVPGSQRVHLLEGGHALREPALQILFPRASGAVPT